MDLIDRQAAIDALWKALYEYEDKTEKQFIESEELGVGDWFLHRIFVQNMSDIDIQTILNLPSAQRWIPCSERLPDYNVPVLTWDSATYQVEKRIPCIIGDDAEPIFSDWWVSDEYDEDESLYYPNLRDGAAIAWMPLPEPYREDGDGDV